ncbi:putative SUMO1/Ulp2 [Trypanosoma rangeli]|uniref:Putative SUMO1/Ulp2 n=1 Tax=Trypanosoma rangeli TaxID=5698 RepID=A0A422N007_TRYRA|nr:putative SUMO1/Ulp2 [Trypanosoma rangeli]RNE98812.1 putative SUMO1/Ulp2 [Trypanosoma rangeli]|eukprot:RNE98812.1 putative SUMO1/Ulp2 [Trypanosoma rangeli]
MTHALLSSVGWAYRGLFSLRQPQQQPGEEEEEAWERSPQDWGGLPSPAVRPPAGGVEVYAERTVDDNAGWRHNTFPLFGRFSSCRSRRRRRSPDSGKRETCGSRHTLHRFVEVFRSRSLRSREGGIPISVEEEVEEDPVASPAASWSLTMTSAASTPGAVDEALAEHSRSRTLAPHEKQQQPVTMEDMRNRVMSAPLSLWEVPLLEELGQNGHLDGREATGIGNNGVEGKMLFASLETPQGTPPPRSPLEAEALVSRMTLRDDTTATALLPSAAAKKQNTVCERDAHLLALHVHEMGSLLQRGSRCSDAPIDAVAAAAQKSCGVKLLAEEQPPSTPMEESTVFDDLSRRFLFSVVTGEDRRVRTVYEDVMSTVCTGIIEEEVIHHIQRMEGAALRALDYWAVEVIVTELTEVKQRLLSAPALSSGIQRHIKGRKAAVLTALTEDAKDKEVYASVLRRGRGNSSQAQETAVSFKNGLTLSYQQLATLGPGQWLNDQVINAYLSMIVEERNQAAGKEVVVSLGTHFFARVQQELPHSSCTASGLPALHKDSGILRWLKRRRHILQPGVTRIVLIPVNLSQTHWALAVLNWELRTWFYYDSYIKSTAAMTRGAEVLHLLAHVFLESKRILCETEAGDACPPADWRLVVAVPLRVGECCSDGGFAVAPQQTNMYDCGVFVCHTVWCAVQGIATIFTQDAVTAHRKVMLHELLCQQSLLQLPVIAFLTP